MKGTRLDIAMVERGFVQSRSAAQGIILAGVVCINGRIAEKASQIVKDGDTIIVGQQKNTSVAEGTSWKRR